MSRSVLFSGGRQKDGHHLSKIGTSFMKTATRTLMLSTALSFPLAGFVSAQTLEGMSDEDLRGKSAECQALVEAVRSDELPGMVPMSDVTTAVENDNAEEF